MTASGRMSIPKSRFNLLSAEPKGVLTVRILLLGTVNPLAVKTLVSGHGVPGILQGHLWAPEPHPTFPPGRSDAEGSTHWHYPLWRPSPCKSATCRCLSALLGPSHLEQILLSGKNIIVFLATCLLLQSQYLWR